MMLDIIARVKLFFAKDKDFRAELAGILGFLPIKIEYYKIAFSHSSNQYRSPKGGKKFNNERLEFLGDAILEAVVSDLVFHHFENKREGFLTNTRSKIVQRSMLNELATEMGVDRLLRTGIRGQSHNSNIGGNAFEALIGAIYLDRGYSACKKFVKKQILRKFVNIDDVAQKEVNFKSKILEYCQKNRIIPEFKLKSAEKDEANNPLFRSILDIEGVMVGDGKGYSKKESEQNACRDALLRMRRSQALVNQIFEAKEKRTSTEAPIFVAVPKIDEIEAEIAQMNEAKTERRRQQRTRQRERREEKAELEAKTLAIEQPQKQESTQTAPKKEKQSSEKAEPKAVQNTTPSPKERKNEAVKPAASNNETAKPEKTKAQAVARQTKGNAPEKKSEVGQEPTIQEDIDVSLDLDEVKIPEPLFLLSDIKKISVPADEPAPSEQSEPINKARKPRRSKRKPASKDIDAAAASANKPSEEEKASAEVQPEIPTKEGTAEPTAEKEKKPRSSSRRRKTNAKTSEKKQEKAAQSDSDAATAPAQSLSDIPTLPFAPQD
ncbi:MAG: ribonuclease III [Bacteroidaceae bacterium]|nr:ribonuclease III [Bacteroidaceae bacterium]